MPDMEVYKEFIDNGFEMHNSDYNRLDTLESDDDLTMLFDLLSKFRDTEGNPAVFTANSIVGNPDFERIRKSRFESYYVEPVSETLKKYPGREQVEQLWKQGIKDGIYHPQFHGREHVNVIRWMEALRAQTDAIKFTFDRHTTFSGDGDYNFMEVLDFNSREDLSQMKNSLTEGLDMFEEQFGFRSKSFIPPCYTWNSDVEQTLAEGGVRYLQGLVTQLVPTGTFGNYNKKYHFLGSKNRFGQYFLVRNAFFEPSLNKSSDPVGRCMGRINQAFRWNKPAIIGTHRINYMGSLDEQNRAANLTYLEELLRGIQRAWPDVLFMTSDRLGDLISGEDV